LEFGWKIASIRARFRDACNRLKLLKLQTLRINGDCHDYSTKKARFRGAVKRRIEGVTRRGEPEVAGRLARSA
jgi:hypothetical protein